MHALNQSRCAPPLDAQEVDRISGSVWRLTLSGTNRPPLARADHMRDLYRRVGRRVRSLALWGLLSQGRMDHSDIELSPSRVVGMAPGWSRRDADAAIKGLVELQILQTLVPGGKGRGRIARYRLAEPFNARVDFAAALKAVEGDAAAVALLTFMDACWGHAGVAPISAEGMSKHVGGPFSEWTRVKIEKARAKLETAGLIKRSSAKRSVAELRNRRRPRAMFHLCCGCVLRAPLDVPKMPEIVRVEIHAPPLTLGAVAASSESCETAQSARDGGIIELYPGPSASVGHLEPPKWPLKSTFEGALKIFGGRK